MHTEAGAATLQRPTRQGFPPSGARGRAGCKLGQGWRPGSGSGYSDAGETSPRGTKPKEKKMEEWGEKKTLTSSKIKNRRRTPHPEPAPKWAASKQACGLPPPLREKGAGDGPARVPLSLTQHTHTRATPQSQAPGRYVTAKPQRCTQATQPASQAATGERSPRPALLSRVPPLMASRDVTTPTSSPLNWEPRTTELASSLAPPLLLSQAPPPGRPMGSRPHPPPRRSLNVFRVSVGLGLLLLRGSPARLLFLISQQLSVGHLAL